MDIIKKLAKNTNLDWVPTIKIGSDILPNKPGEDISFKLHHWEISKNGDFPINKGESVLIDRNGGFPRWYILTDIDGLNLTLTPLSNDSFIKEKINSGTVLEIKTLDK